MARIKQVAFLFLLFAFAVQPLPAQTKTPRFGRYVEKNAQGKRTVIGHYRKSKKSGHWFYFDENGLLIKEEKYRKGLKNGTYREYYDRNKLKAYGYYVMGEPHGEWKTWLPSGTLFDEKNYALGVPEGTWTYMTLFGKKSKEENYGGGKLDGWQKEWYENGNLASECLYEKGHKNGELKNYDPDGRPTLLAHYKSDVLHGAYSEWSEGHLLISRNYEDGALHGDQLRFTAEGDTLAFEQYEHGLLQGIQKRYENKYCVYEALNSEGKKNGTAISRGPGGKPVLLQEWYTMDRLDSVFAAYANGNRKYFRRYDSRGQLHGTYEEWSEGGKLLVQGQYVHGVKTGAWTVFYPDGHKKSLVAFENGRAQGLFQRWYANGRTVLKQEYDKGVPQGYAQIWDDRGNPFRRGSLMYEAILASSLIDETFVGAYDEPGLPSPPDRTKTKSSTTTTYIYDVIEPPVPEPPVLIADEEALFPGGQPALFNYIITHVIYPAEEREAGKTGTVYISFVVERDGQVSNVKALKEVAGAPGLTSEAIRVVKSLPRFNAAKMNGRPVRMQMAIPVKFVLR